MAGIMTRDAAEAGRYITGMPGIRELIDRIPEDREQLICFGEISPSSAELQQLETEIRKILADNHQVSLVMVNLPAKHSESNLCRGGAGFLSDGIDGAPPGNPRCHRSVQ